MEVTCQLWLLFNDYYDEDDDDDGPLFSWGDASRSCLLPCLIEVKYSQKHLRLCRLLLRHGMVEAFSDMLEIVITVEHLPNRDSDFYSERFLRLMILAGVDFSKRHIVLKRFDLPEEDISLYAKYLSRVDRELKRPRSLQDYCIMTVRRTLSVGGQLWSKIDSLPLPTLLKDELKLLLV